jgi:hypothetical protein
MAQDKAPATLDTDRCALPINPVESTALGMRAIRVHLRLFEWSGAHARHHGTQG